MKSATTSDWQAKSQNECELRLFDIRGDSGEQLPAVLLTPKTWNKRLVIWADGAGKSAFFEHSDLRPSVKQLLDAGVAVLGVDLLDQGEFLSDGKPLTKTRRVENSRDYAGFTFGYNRPLFAERVDDLLTVISVIRDANGLQGQGASVPERVYLVGTGGAGPIAAAAQAQPGSKIDRLAIDTGHFRFADLKSIDDPDFLPGAVKYGDLEAILALSAPNDLWITGDSPNQLDLPRAAYHAAGAEGHLTIDSGPAESVESRLVEWLLR